MAHTVKLLQLGKAVSTASGVCIYRRGFLNWKCHSEWSGHIHPSQVWHYACPPSAHGIALWLHCIYIPGNSSSIIGRAALDLWVLNGAVVCVLIVL